MSILAGRLAGKEGAFFYEQTKNAVSRLAAKAPSIPASAEANLDASADVLPEVLRHSLPPKIFATTPTPVSHSRFASSKWAIQGSESKSTTSIASDVHNPLTAYVSLPKVSFGPRRWELPAGDHAVLASTANELRRDRYIPANPEKLKAAAAGLSMIGKAFAVATTLVFGSAAVVLSFTINKLDLRNSEDIPTKVKDRTQPKVEMIRDQLAPLRIWAQETSRKWHIEQEVLKENPVIKELSRNIN